MATLPAGNHCVSGTNTIRIGYEIVPLHSGCGPQTITFIVRRYCGWENVRTSCNNDSYVARISPVSTTGPCGARYDPSIAISSTLGAATPVGNGIAIGTGVGNVSISNCLSSSISGTAIIDTYSAWSNRTGTGPLPTFSSVPEVTGSTVSISGQ